MTELNLNDPATIEKLKEVDVLSNEPDKEIEKVEKQISKLRRSSTFKLKLDHAQLAFVQRAALEAGVENWEDWLQAEILKLVFNGKIAQPRISRPSWGKEIKGPSTLNHVKPHHH